MNTRRLLVALSYLFLWVPMPACFGQLPAKAADVGTVPGRHGIALFGVRSHHLDLAMALLEGEDDPSEPVKRLRAELHLRAEQLPKLMTCLDKARSPIDKAKEAVGTLKVFDATEKNLLAQFPKLLSDKQQTRFEELACQLAGPMALRLKHYASRLELSTAQRTSIHDLVETYTDKAAELHRAGFVVRSADAEKKLKALASQLDEKILWLLTEKQRAKWTSLLGKRFDWTGILEE